MKIEYLWMSLLSVILKIVPQSSVEGNEFGSGNEWNLEVGMRKAEKRMTNVEGKSLIRTE